MLIHVGDDSQKIQHENRAKCCGEEFSSSRCRVSDFDSDKTVIGIARGGVLVYSCVSLHVGTLSPWTRVYNTSRIKYLFSTYKWTIYKLSTLFAILRSPFAFLTLSNSTYSRHVFHASLFRFFLFSFSFFLVSRSLPSQIFL